jgi:hypothetical protein
LPDPADALAPAAILLLPLIGVTATSAYGTVVLLAGRRAFLVTRIDIDPEFGETTDNVAREAASRLRQAVAECAQQRTPRYLALAGLSAALATALLYLVVRGTIAVDGHPVATAAAVSATVAVTSAVVGSMVRAVPAGCVPVNYRGVIYQQCGSTWYQPQGSQFVVIAPPY